ncbi:unnamed protein product [Peronospora belbahrii]|uniref:UVR domain-containing protein n=1 Tax=Peronospora belbahrii TaxID=622444 RepID=A0ABN8D624_9STRA|nr:unnamed protein product [Peronospora belbahrii]
MFGRFFKNKEDGRHGPPGHQRGGQHGDIEPPAGGGFFNLPPPVSKPYSGSTAAVSSVSSTSMGGGGAAVGGFSHPPIYGNSSAPPDNSSMSAKAFTGGGMDMFGGMSVKAPSVAGGGSNNGMGRYQPQIQQQQQHYGGYGGAGPPITAMQLSKAGGSLFSGLEVAAGAPAPAVNDDGGGLTKLTHGSEQRKSSRSTGSFNHQHVASSKSMNASVASQYSRTSAGSSAGTTTLRTTSKAVKKKKTKTFRPGFGRQLSDESAAALQRGDLKEDDIIHQREGRLMSDRSDSLRSSRSATGPTDLAHLLPPVKAGSVLQGLTVHKGSNTSGGGVLAGLTVHKSASPSRLPIKVAESADTEFGGNGVLSGLSIYRIPPSSADDDAREPVNDALAEEPAPEVCKKPSSPVPAASPTPEERLFSTLRDFHESAVSFRQLTVKQNEEENRLMERKAQLAHQLTQYELDLRDVEAQQHHACEVEDFEKADALNASINSVRHCITLTESDVRKVDSDLVAFVKAKEKAFANQLRSTRGTLRELEKFREDQELERTVARNQYKIYEANQTEQLQFEAERIDTEMHHVSVSLENVISEKSEIEATIEGQCRPEFAVQAQLMEEKKAVEEEVRELERKLKEKLERVQEIQSSIDTAQRDIDTVRKRYSRQLKRIAEREDGIKKTKSEVESDGKHLEQQREEFHDRLKQYTEDISIIGKRIGAVKKEMRAASLLANVLEVQETRREQSLIRKRQQTAELSSLNDATAVAEQSFTMLSKQHEELEKSLSIHRNAIASAEAMIPRLEQEKKAAAAQRNFKEAARISKDIKALEKDRLTAEENVEVVDLELQDLTERIAKREVEFEEKKKELKEMEKHLELATLQELWKEAKHLRTALRKIEKCRSEGNAANGGIDFRSSAILLVQAEYDACMVQVEALEKKYDVACPVDDEDDKDDDDDDESIDDEEKEGSEHVSLLRSSLAGKLTTDTEGSDVDIEATDNSSFVLEKIVGQLLELESQIEKATDNEEYELAARLDAKIETLKQRQETIEAVLSQEVTNGVQENESLGDEESNGRDYSADEGAEADVEYVHEEMVSPVSVSRSRDELAQSLEAVQVRVAMLERQIDVATENEDFEIAASYEKELQSLREREKRVGAQLESPDGSRSVTAPVMFGGRDLKTDKSTSVEDVASGVSPRLPQDTLVDSETSGSLFGGLQMSGGPGAASKSSIEVPITESDLEVEEIALESVEAACPAKPEIVFPTSSEMKDSFFGKRSVSNNSASLIAPSTSGSLFGALQISGSYSVDRASLPSLEKKTEEDKEDAQSPDARVTKKVELSASTPVDNGSSAVDVGASARTESISVLKEGCGDMFGGLQLSSSAVADTTTAAVDSDSMNTPQGIFNGLKLSSSLVGAASSEHSSSDTSSNMFGGLKVSGSAVGASNEAPTEVFGGLELSNNAIVAGAAETDANVAPSTEETDLSANGVGNTRMSIHELREQIENGDVVEVPQGASFHSDAPAVTSATLLSETTSPETTVVSLPTTTNVTFNNDKTQTETEQEATRP